MTDYLNNILTNSGFKVSTEESTETETLTEIPIEDLESNAGSESIENSAKLSIIHIISILLLGIVIILSTLLLLGLIGSTFAELNYCTPNFNFGYCLLSGFITFALAFMNSFYLSLIVWPVGFLIIISYTNQKFNIKDCFDFYFNDTRKKYPICYYIGTLIHITTALFVIPLIGTSNMFIDFGEKFCSINTYRKNFMGCAVVGWMNTTFLFLIIYFVLGISWLVGSLVRNQCLKKIDLESESNVDIETE